MSHTTCVHPATKAARSACRKAKANRDSLIPMINDAYDALYVALTSDNVAEYTRLELVINGLLIAFTDGDLNYASALRNLWSDSMEHLEWYLETISYEEAVMRFSTTISDADRKAMYDASNQED